MAEPVKRVPAVERSRTIRFLVVAGLLLLLLPVIWGIRSWHLDRADETIDPRIRGEVTDALNAIDARFHEMQQDLLERARRVAEDPFVVRGLRTRARQEMEDGPEELVSYFLDLEVDRRSSIELYDIGTRLAAWRGFSMPLTETPAPGRFVSPFQTTIAHDDGVRQALVVWWPVREGRDVLGAVRAMRLIHFDAPIRNEHLRDVSLAERWERQTRLNVVADFDPAAALEQTRDPSRLLEGADGRVLGRVSVEPPSPDKILASIKARYDQAIVLSLTLLALWLMAGLWLWYRRRLREEAPRIRHEPPWHLLARFAAVAAAWWMLRYIFLYLDVPARWQRGKSPLAPLFDPIHLASGLGNGLLQSTGDVLVTGLFLVAFAGAFVEVASWFRDRAALLIRGRGRLLLRGRRTTWSALLASLAASMIIALLTILLALAIQRLVLDSTLDFFARKGLLPDPLLLVVYGAFILITAGVLLISVGIVWIALAEIVRNRTDDVSARRYWISNSLGSLIPLVLLYGLTELNELLPWSTALSFLLVAGGVAFYLVIRRESLLSLLILRTVLPTAFVITVLLYPLLYNGMDTQRKIEMREAAETFAEGRDPRVVFAMEQILQLLRSEDETRRLLARPDDHGDRLDSLALSSVRGTLLAALPAFEVSLTVMSREGEPVGRYDGGQTLDRQTLNRLDALEFEIIRDMYEEAGATGVMVEQVTGRREPDRLQYEGIAAVYERNEDELLGWILIRAEPQPVFSEGRTPFPRVLLPAGMYDDLYGNVSVAEFRNGVLVRSAGRDFGRFRLPDAVRQAVAAESEVWRKDRVNEREYRTYYRRVEPDLRTETSPIFVPTAAGSVVAVRVPGVHTFDHLYYLLRLTVAGMFIALPVYLFGLGLRRRAGLLPARRVKFRDKVLNAFLVVGIIAVGAVGWIGLQVVTEENERAIQSWLRQHLDRVEEAISLEIRGEEMPYRALDRIRIDSLAARIRLDLNVYDRYELSSLSRPQLLRERLIDRRLPIEAYHALYFEGYRFTHSEDRVGDFMYTTGFRALPDEQGRPRFVLSVPTLPEQEQIEEDRARTVAYLFGALLLLVLVVMFTASLLANAISRPIARLRSGLKAVAAGRFERMLPVNSRDEIGDLVQTFNEMQDQLAESRRRLAQQERQLAWREMARQVAHEIKNPLTPMKLSVQHLRRAFESDGMDPRQATRFKSLFERITSTLIEQIDTLARIANEFHSFARLPSRLLEKLDLNAVVDEAVALMQEESSVEISLALYPEPIIVEADREELRRDYINLIKNAIQSIPVDRPGRVIVTTEIEQTNASVWALSAVADNGMGVQEQLRDKIFEPNFSTKTSGAGLGLAIVKKSVEELQGEIGFETAEGEGSTFWIRLPVAEDRP